MRLVTDRLIIQGFKQEDEKAYVEMALDGSLNDIFGDCKECNKWMLGWIKEAIELDKKNNPYKEYLAYAILEKKSNKVIGSVGCSYYEDLKQVGITYFIGRIYRGKGYAAEASKAYAKYFLESYDSSEIIATIRIENEASCRTIERVGFLLHETRLYKDINDSKEQQYNFYVLKG